MNKTEKRLHTSVKDRLQRYGLSFTKDDRYYHVSTPFGDWQICPEHENRSKLVTIYTKFAEPERVDKTLFKDFAYNNFSGKLNFHHMKENEELMMEEFDQLCNIVSNI